MKIANRQYDDHSKSSPFSNMTSRGKLRALLQKNFLRMWRNVGVMLFIFVLPVMQVILFCLAIGRDPKDLKLGVVNSEMDWESKSCPVATGCNFTQLSCRYLKFLDNSSISKQYYRDENAAMNAIRSGNVWGAIQFGTNFTENLVARVFLGKEVDDETLDLSEIRVWLDMSSKYQVLIHLFLVSHF